MSRASLGLAALLLLAAPAAAGDVGFVEGFALAPDRTEPLKSLVPGTDEFYYYHALHLLNTERFGPARDLTRAWHQRHGQTPRLTEIQTRHALLTFDRDPQATLGYLRGRLGPNLDHRREVPGAAPDLPTRLDPTLVSRDTLTRRAFERSSGLDQFEDAALPRLAAPDLPPQRLRELLARVRRPDLPDLPKLIDADLRADNAAPFGGRPIDLLLTTSQLDELAVLRPDVLNQLPFVTAYLQRLQPGADDDRSRDRAVAAAHLDRLLKFADRLAPVYNSLKAHVLYHKLLHDRAGGVHDKALFLRYLGLPRRQPYMNPAVNDAPAGRDFPADLQADFAAATLLPPVGPDEPLVRDLLRHFLRDAAGPAEFEPVLEPTFLRELFAEVKLEAGLGDPERWAAVLPPDRFRALRERVDIDFAPTNRTQFAAADPVVLDLHVKNVPTLLVKVFEVNTGAVYRATQREIDTDLQLDGLAANGEQTHKYPDPPLRRVARRFEFPDLTRPGVYVIDFIGAGKNSRALVRKGRLRPVVTPGTAGLNVRVIDEASNPVPAATVWLGGTEYTPDKDGVTTLPYSTSPGRKPVVLSAGGLSSLDAIDHPGEGYSLAAGIYVDRESLLAQRLAPVVVRPALLLNGRRVPVSLLENARLRVVTTDLSGVSGAVEAPGFKLFEDRESVQPVRVPARLASLSVTLSATVRSLTADKPVELSVTETVAVNAIDRTQAVDALHLAQFGPDYAVELLGKTGEPKPDRAVGFRVKHREFKEEVHFQLKTDARGRIVLGPLPDVTRIVAAGPDGVESTWPLLPADRASVRPAVHAAAGEAVRVPNPGSGDKPSRDEVALFEVRDNTVRADRFDAVSVKAGLLELTGLAPGDYDLHLKRENQTVRVRVAAGPSRDGFVLGRTRQVEAGGLPPLAIAGVTTDADAVTVRLGGASKFARVHVFASRYRPAFDPFGKLGAVPDTPLTAVYPGFAPSAFLTGRDIGDEYRYVLDRRAQKRFPGVMVERPRLLLNPWAVRQTETGVQEAVAGGAFGAAGGAAPSRSEAPAAAKPTPPPPPPGGDFANLDFLADASAVLVNLVADKDGVVRVPRKDIGPHSLVHVVAADPLSTAVRTVSLPEVPARTLDLRLLAGLDPSKHFTQRREASILPAGQPFVLDDVSAGRFQAYDSLGKVHALFVTLLPDPKLTEFAFVTTWPKRTDAEKRALYSKHACHELNFFLSRKDPAFFAAVVKPYLANKKDKQFLDHYLLGDDLREFARPWAFGRLNAVEKVLLGRRLADERPRVERHLRELLALVPADVARGERLFEFSLLGDSLKDGDRLAEQRAAGSRARLSPEPMDAPAPATPPAAPGEPKAMDRLQQEAKAMDEAGGRGGVNRGAVDAAGKPADRPDGGRSNEALELRDAAKKADQFFQDDRAKKLSLGREVRQLYRTIAPTEEWAENNYYKLPLAQHTPALVPVGPLWAEWAAAGDRPFLSPRFADAARTFTEALFALSVLDLPFEAGPHAQTFAAGKMTYTPATPVVAVSEQVRPAEAPKGPATVLLSQNLFRAADRYRVENGERADKFVTGELLTHVVYGSQVVVTNPTSGRQRLAVLVQLPVGAVAVGGASATRTVPLDLPAYHTQAIDTLFYFPRPGTFAQFPAHVSKGETVVAAAPAATVTVVDRLSKPDTGSWDHVSQNGTLDEVLAFVGRENVHALNLDKLAWRLRDRAAFDAILAALTARHVYSPTLWAYSLLHGDPATAREYLQHADNLVAEAGGPLTSPLLTIDPVARHSFEHLEYSPLANARAHSLGTQRQIVNPVLLAQYQRFLHTLTYRRELTPADHLQATYYLLLQDRVEEAAGHFAKADPAAVPTRLQYDYFAAYLGLATGDSGRAREVATKHAGHPVDRWRDAFATLLRHLDEADGKTPAPPSGGDQAQTQGGLAATEPAVEVAVVDRTVQVTARNLPAVTVNYHLMDVELLFSRSPFVQQADGQFAVIRPFRTATLPVPAGGKLQVPVPDDLVKRNLLVEVVGGGKTRTAVYYAAAMGVTLIEGYGQLTATAPDGKPLPAVYVKVYARLADGTVRFHKDGYTDRRGRFDYATVSGPTASGVGRFAVLALSDDRGAVIREAAPPAR